MEEENLNPAQNNQELPPLPPKQEPEPQLNKEEVENKKASFMKRIKLIGFVVIGLISFASLFAIVRFAYNQNKTTYSTEKVEESTQSSDGTFLDKPEHPLADNEWEIYASEKYMMSFEYPKGDLLKVTDTSADEFLVQVFSQGIVPAENPDGDNLVNGYIFQIKPLELGARSLESAVGVKRDFYLNKCPDTASVTDIVGIKVSEIEGLGFNVYSCNSDYSVDYVTSSGLVYEITQIYKGDVGFKQVYKSKTNQILSTVEITPEKVEESPYVEYVSNNGFSFSYPRGMDTQYSNVPFPPYERAQQLVTLAESDDTNAVGFFFIRDSSSDFNFDNLVAEQTQLLVDDYTVVKGSAPQGTKEEFLVDGQKAVRLENYSWKGNNLIYIELPNSKGALVLSYTNISEEILNGIIDSIKFEK